VAPDRRKNLAGHIIRFRKPLHPSIGSKAPWPDVIPKPRLIKQLPLLNQFFNVELLPAASTDTLESTKFLVQTLGVVTASTFAFSFGQSCGQLFGNRPAKLRRQINPTISDFLSRLFSATLAASLQKELVAEAVAVKTQIKHSTAKKITTVCSSRLSAFTGLNNARFVDLSADVSPQSVVWTPVEVSTKERQRGQFLTRVRTDHEHSKSVLHEMHSRLE
jgi:hypothetical protein